eukprot:2482869-Prymnesium_polylepis.1
MGRLSTGELCGCGRLTSARVRGAASRLDLALDVACRNEGRRKHECLHRVFSFSRIWGAQTYVASIHLAPASPRRISEVTNDSTSASSRRAASFSGGRVGSEKSWQRFEGWQSELAHEKVSHGGEAHNRS